MSPVSVSSLTKFKSESVIGVRCQTPIPVAQNKDVIDVGHIVANLENSDGFESVAMMGVE